MQHKSSAYGHPTLVMCTVHCVQIDFQSAHQIDLALLQFNIC